jgi:hypothetical protein
MPGRPDRRASGHSVDAGGQTDDAFDALPDAKE